MLYSMVGFHRLYAMGLSFTPIPLSQLPEYVHKATIH